MPSFLLLKSNNAKKCDQNRDNILSERIFPNTYFFHNIILEKGACHPQTSSFFSASKGG